MKKLLFVAAVGAMTFACSNSPEGEKVDAQEAQEVKEVEATSETYAVAADESMIMWEGSDVAGKMHNGAIYLNSGEIMVEDGNIVGGNFTIDMGSIENYDVEDEEYNAKLVGHLKSPDFFNVDSFPTAKFEITDVAALEGDTAFTHQISGNLMMKDQTKNITFKANVTMDNGSIMAETSNFVIDRAQWNVKFRSPSFFSMDELKDKAINDEMGIKIKLMASK